jgi:hypothetical protein
MPQSAWSLHGGRPAVEVVLTEANTHRPLTRLLLADTGAGALHVAIDLLLDVDDCLLAGASPHESVSLGGAYRGNFPTYLCGSRCPPSDLIMN